MMRFLGGVFIKEINLNDFLIEYDYLEKICINNIYNKMIINYYYRLGYENTEIHLNLNGEPFYKYSKKGQRYFGIGNDIKKCNEIWHLDFYKDFEIGDYKGTYLCRDKFCSNCKKVKQAERMSRYIPELEKYKDNLYHLVLTLPNVSGAQLKKTIKKMSKSFTYLIEYLKGKKKIVGIDFSDYGYIGAVRSLEITFKNDDYHPHYHVALILNGSIGEKLHVNKYSHDYYGNRDIRKFSELEILIQKIWYCLLNDIRLTKKNIDELDIGYSCMIDKFTDNDYIELFKYMTKSTNEKGQFLSYENFKTLYNSLLGLKQIQGYGVLYRINDDDISDEVDKVYLEIKELLGSDTNVIDLNIKVNHLLTNFETIKLISRKKIYSYLRNIE